MTRGSFLVLKVRALKVLKFNLCKKKKIDVSLKIEKKIVNVKVSVIWSVRLQIINKKGDRCLSIVVYQNHNFFFLILVFENDNNST